MKEAEHCVCACVRVRGSCSSRQLVDARVPFIIEAVTESLEVKRSIFAALRGTPSHPATPATELHGPSAAR